MKHISIPTVTVLLAIAGFSFSSCGESAKEKAERTTKDSIHRHDSLIKPRKEIYEASLGALKELLKVPSTAKFPAIQLYNDTVKMRYSKTNATVMFPYDAQNPMGAYMHGYAAISLTNRDGKWKVEDPYSGVNTSDYNSTLYKYFDTTMKDVSVGGLTPAPVPAPAPMPH